MGYIFWQLDKLEVLIFSQANSSNIFWVGFLSKIIWPITGSRDQKRITDAAFVQYQE